MTPSSLINTFVYVCSDILCSETEAIVIPCAWLILIIEQRRKNVIEYLYINRRKQAGPDAIRKFDYQWRLKDDINWDEIAVV